MAMTIDDPGWATKLVGELAVTVHVSVGITTSDDDELAGKSIVAGVAVGVGPPPPALGI